MKLLRVGNKGTEKPALLDKNGKIRDISSPVSYTHLRAHET